MSATIKWNMMVFARLETSRWQEQNSQNLSLVCISCHAIMMDVQKTTKISLILQSHMVCKRNLELYSFEFRRAIVTYAAQCRTLKSQKHQLLFWIKHQWNHRRVCCENGDCKNTWKIKSTKFLTRTKCIWCRKKTERIREIIGLGKAFPWDRVYTSIIIRNRDLMN